jgi:hypothetical protein
MCPQPDSSRWKTLRACNKADLRVLVAFITGHITLRRHLSIVKEMEQADIRCRLCGNEEETPIHLLKCPATELLRQQYDGLPTKDELTYLSFCKDILRRVRTFDSRDTPEREEREENQDEDSHQDFQPPISE